MEVKKWWHSKGFWLGVIAILTGVVEFIFGLPAGASVGTIILGIAQIIIRFLTNQPIR